LKLGCTIANGAWVASSLPATRSFASGFDRAAETQTKILLRIIARNAQTDFGRQHDFRSIRSVAGFQHHVPVRTYEDFAPFVSRIESGETNVLTASPIDHLEPTSGSSGASKLIPYTRELREEFGRAIAPWIGSMAIRNPRAFLGPSYWSLSPMTKSRTTSGGIRIGFDRDDEYLGRVRGWLARSVQATDALNCRSLSFISVWHPSFLLRLIEDVGDVPSLWPNLAAISCWTDAASSLAASELARRFPQVRIEPKGLLSTEGVVSIPFDGVHVLAYRSHFYELQSDGEVIPATDAVTGRRYRVILTTGGGLYRYATGDVVEVAGFRGRCPLLRFLGRADRVSDRFGEKLNEIFVRERLERVLRESDVVTPFAVVACEATATSGRYKLFIETDSSDATIDSVAGRLEELLHENFHYDYCRRLGQLSALRAIRTGAGSASKHLLLLASLRGQRLGTVKPPVLENDPAMIAEFQAWADARHP
jgi:GH3 auxin-responsive promoter